MKSLKIILGLFILIILNVSAAYAQQQFTHTVTAKNKYCNATCSIMDVRELNDNPAAVILVTPSAENTRNLNPHPVGVYYVPFSKKWSVTNTDQTAIGEGAKFNIQYYPRPDANQFVYVISQRATKPCIDHPGLNSNPNAQIRFSATGSRRGAYFNPFEIKIEYEASALKWCLESVNYQELLKADTAYNVVITSGTPVGTSAPPLVVVAREDWLVPQKGSIAPLSPGKCETVTPGYENPVILRTDHVILTPQQSTGNPDWLRWTGTIQDGSVLITVCNTKEVLPNSGATVVGGRRVNILVLR